MDDRQCVAFLQAVLPSLGLQWRGYRKVRRQVCRRIQARMRELSLDSPEAYRRLLQAQPEEARALDSTCRVTISRFYRDRGVFESLVTNVLPAAAARCSSGLLRALSLGCASGEEVYSLVLVWQYHWQASFRPVTLLVLGIDANDVVLERARRGVFASGSLKALPPHLKQFGMQEEASGHYRVREQVRQAVRFEQGDIRAGLPAGPFDIVLCRNLAFTYFAPDVQLQVTRAMSQVMPPGAFLLLGGHESLPESQPWFDSQCRGLPIYVRSRAND